MKTTLLIISLYLFATFVVADGGCHPERCGFLFLTCRQVCSCDLKTVKCCEACASCLFYEHSQCCDCILPLKYCKEPKTENVGKITNNMLTKRNLVTCSKNFTKNYYQHHQHHFHHENSTIAAQ